MVALITGASRGLGKALAVFFADKGFDLHLVARNSELLNEVKSELENQFSVDVNVYPCDFSNPKNTEKLAVKLSSTIQQLDMLINNAGVFEMGILEESSSEQVQKLLNINLMGAFNLSKVFIPMFKKQGKGHVFNIGSIVTEHPRKDIAAYTISKFALKGLTETLRDELKDFQVKVTELIPGSINTSSWDGIDNIPKQDFIQTEELVQAIWMCFNNTIASNIETLTIRPLNRNF
ncbi:MAG: 3-oxoacyl-[acyl-carrier protein] reductase [Glaciecola sp.]|jgi:3-oxoacyl-[acyl-carrier protein] reductase